MSKSKQIKNNMTSAVATVMLSLTGAVLAYEDEHGMEADAAGGEARIMHLAGEHDLTFGAGITMIAQSLTAGATDDVGVTYSADIAFEGNFG